MQRHFFAIWPDAGAARALERLSLDLARACGGRAVAAERIHLTLVFLGEVEPERIEAVKSAGGAVLGPPFDVALDCVGSFRGARVAWAGSREPSAELLALHSRLAAELRARGFALEARPFAPHLTLVRRLGKAVVPTPIEPIEWRARELALVASDLGAGRYSNVAAWDLG